MNWLEAVVYGLPQALTEFLPISSSARLRIVGPFLTTGGDPGAAFTGRLRRDRAVLRLVSTRTFLPSFIYRVVLDLVVLGLLHAGRPEPL